MSEQTQKLVFVSGMKRSGSTWSYNVCRFLLDDVFGETRVAKGYVGERKAIEDVIDNLNATDHNKAVTKNKDVILLKFHFPTARLIELVASGRAKNVYTYRNPLNALASDIEFFHLPFDQSLNNILHCLKAMHEWRKHPGTLFIDFSNINAHPTEEIRRIAEHLGLTANEATMERCAEANSYQKIKQVSEEMAHWAPERLTRTNAKNPLTFDPVTLLHVRHAPTGAARDWRKTLTKDQAKKAVDIMEPWLPENYKSLFSEIDF